MALLAHLSDAHLFELDAGDRSASEWARFVFLSCYRPSTASRRAERFASALARCARAGVDHVAFTGDLTEDASRGQLALARELLEGSGIPPTKFTMVPGNHDAYRGKATLETSFSHVLGPYYDADAEVSLDGARLVPLDSTIEQHYVGAAGELGGKQLERLDRLPSTQGPVVVLQHHPPLRHSLPGLGAFQELRDVDAQRALLDRRGHLHVLHGHVHRDRAYGLPGDAGPRFFSVRATVESDDPVRFYEVDENGVRPVKV